MMFRRSVLCALGVVAAAASARAGDVDKYLPDDTEMVVSVNVKQIVESDLFKKYVEESAREALKNNDELQDALKDLGLDPFKDIERLIAARPSGTDQDRGLLIVHGQFDQDKFKAKAEQMAKDHPDQVKVLKVNDGSGGKLLIYEVTPTEKGAPVFLALPEHATLLASPGKDYLVEALRRDIAKGKPQLKNADMQALLERMNDKQGLSVAMVGSALTEGASQNVKDFFAKVDAVGGGVSVGDEIKIEVAVSAKDADAAKEIKDSIAGGLKQAKLFIAALSFEENPQIEAMLDLVNSVKVSAKDKTVLLKGAVSTDVLEEAFKKEKEKDK